MLKIQSNIFIKPADKKNYLIILNLWTTVLDIQLKNIWDITIILEWKDTRYSAKGSAREK